MRVIRRLQHPAVTVAAVVVLLMSVASIPRGFGNPGSVVGEILWHNTRRPTAYPQSEMWYLGRVDERWLVLATPWDSADALSHAAAQTPRDIVSVVRQRGIESRGFYDPIVQTRYDTIGTQTLVGTPVETGQMRSLVGALNAFPGFEPFNATAAEYKPDQASVRLTTTRWSAVVNNVVAAVAVLILPISLGWIPRMIRERREARKRIAGNCPGCGYDRCATPADAPCPECGRTLQSFS